MRKTTLATFGDNVLDFQLPDCWEKLTQEQLRYVCYVMSHFEAAKAKAYIFIRLLAIRVYRKVADGWICAVTLESKQKVRFFLWNYQIQCFLKVLDFLDAPAKSPVCLSQIGELRAVNVLLRGVPFSDYIRIENHYQGYLQTNDIRQVQSMAKILYVDKDGNHPVEVRLSEGELLSVFLWYASMKNRFAVSFPHFFGKVGDNVDAEPPDMVEVMNAEIRALTGGDITKENQVLSMDCWRALTELNEKARETQEYNGKYGHN